MSFRPLDPEADGALLHAWVTHPKSRFWGMQDATTRDVVDAYREIDALVGLADGEPAFLMERYDPSSDPVGTSYDVEPGDRGMHFLVAPADEPVHGFTLEVITAVMEKMFEDEATTRVVVEPDARNTAVHRLNAEVGFRPLGVVHLPGKRALLSVCTRDDFMEATR